MSFFTKLPIFSQYAPGYPVNKIIQKIQAILDLRDPKKYSVDYVCFPYAVGIYSGDRKQSSTKNYDGLIFFHDQEDNPWGGSRSTRICFLRMICFDAFHKTDKKNRWTKHVYLRSACHVQIPENSLYDYVDQLNEDDIVSHIMEFIDFVFENPISHSLK